MKSVYFVRHGETLGNASNKFQKWDIPLSETGRQQAAFVAQRFASIPIEAIIASDMERATETARIIASVTKHEVILEPLLRELARPTAVRGLAKTEPEVERIIRFTDTHWLGSEKHSDEENFIELKDRALRALQCIADRPEEKILVVTHGTFLRTLISCMFMQERLDGAVWHAVENYFGIQNTAITWCEYHDSQWKLVTWNDHAHLGDSKLK